jgi:hypothetical protein
MRYRLSTLSGAICRPCLAQEERLKAHRRTQEKEFVWKPPPPKLIPKDNQWDSGKLGKGEEAAPNRKASSDGSELFWS